MGIKTRYKLQTRFSAFFTAFTAVLLISILTFVYWNNVALIKKKAVKDLCDYRTRFQKIFQNHLDGCKLELNTIFNTNPPSLQDINVFITAHPIKYISLTFLDSKSGAIRVVPIKLYGGDIVSKLDTLDAVHSALHNPAAVLSRDRRSIEIGFQYGSDSTTHGYARVSLDYIIEDVLTSLQLPSVFNWFVTDTHHTILHSKTSHLIGSSVDQVSALTGLIQKTVTVYSNKRAWQYSELPSGLILYLRKDLNPEYITVHRTLIRLFLFVLALLAVVLIMVRMMAGRLAASLQEITRVTRRISKGDFSQTIKLQRRDELGELISAFNQMVERLDESYLALDQTNQALEKNLDELSRTRAELSQKQRLALIGETLSKISHEIQNKIGGVSIWVQNLKYYAQNDATIRMYTSEMEQALDSFMKMLSNFKRFYREPQLHLTRFNTTELVRDAICPFVNDAESRDILIKTEFKDRLSIRADRDQLLDVLSNLLMNALYFSPDQSTISCCVCRQKEWCSITICDEGPGIPIGNTEQIFHPFYTTKTSGSGLGLAMAFAVIKAHKGNITVHNEHGRGACFCLYLPLKDHKP